MPAFLIPLHESNDCHNPAGSPTGGEFCAKGPTQFETGKWVSFRYLRNTQKAPNMGERYGQHLEPAGRYMQELETGDTSSAGWETGDITFRNPLVIEFGGGYESPDNWKRVLSQRFGGSTKKRLSMKILKAGYDAVVTMTTTRGIRHASEIVDLTPLLRKP